MSDTRDPRRDPRPGDVVEIDGTGDSLWRVVVRDGRVLIIHNGQNQMAVTLGFWRKRLTRVVLHAAPTESS